MKLFYVLTIALFVGGISMKAKAINLSFDIRPSSCGNATGRAGAILSGGTLPYTYLWSNGNMTFEVNNVIAGSYTLTVTDALGASITQTAVISDFPELQFSDMMWPSSGYSNDGHVDLSVSNGVLPLTYGSCVGVTGNFIGGSITFQNLTGYNPNGPVNGICQPSLSNAGYDYGFIITDATGCSVTDVVTVGASGFETSPTINDACGGNPNGSISDTLIFNAANFIYYPSSALVKIRQGSTLIDSIPISINGPNGNQFGLWYTAPNLLPGIYTIDYYLLDMYSNGPTWQSSVYYTENVIVNSLGTNCGTISGKVYIDSDANCAYSIGETAEEGSIISIQPGNIFTVVDDSGNYSVAVPLGSYTISHNFAYAAPLVSACTGQLVSVNLSIPSQQQIVDFVDSSAGTNVRVDLYVAQVRPGISTTLELTVSNNSAGISAADTIELVLDSIFSVLNSSPAFTDSSQNVFHWVVNALQPFQHSNYMLTFQVPANPNLVGTTVTATASLLHSNDIIQADNSDVVNNVITGSYDPNLLSVAPEGFAVNHYIPVSASPLEYTIEFQNTGNDTAFTIIITDTLDQTIDISSIYPISSSHEYVWSINNHVLTFSFNNILLADSNINEAASHGFVRFSAAIQPATLPGTFIQNKVNIFFDSNPPVPTNQVSQLTFDCNNIISSPPNVIMQCENDSSIIGISTTVPVSVNWTLQGLLLPVHSSVINIPVLSLGVYTLMAEAITPYCTQLQTETVNVIGSPIPVISISNDTIFCHTTAVSYQWYYNGIALTNVTDSICQVTQNGAYYVEVVYASGCSNVSAPVIITGLNGVATVDLLISPNPGSDHLAINIPTGIPGLLNLTVYDETGRLLISRSVENLHEKSYMLNTTELNKGLYEIEINNGSLRAVSRWIKQ